VNFSTYGLPVNRPEYTPSDPARWSLCVFSLSELMQLPDQIEPWIDKLDESVMISAYSKDAGIY
jgi:hypothetical protein